MRLVLCDDNRILCEALAAALETFGHKILAAEITAQDGIAAVARYQPDACLLDLCFPGPPDGLSAARVIRRHDPDTAVLLLTGSDDPGARAAAAEMGVAGFIRKDQRVDRIADALDVIAAGGSVFDSVAGRRLGLRPAGPLPGPMPGALTQREKEVLRRMVAGQSTTQMAREMNIAASTLRTYVKNVLSKLGAHSRLQAVAVAIGHDLLSDDRPD